MFNLKYFKFLRLVILSSFILLLISCKETPINMEPDCSIIDPMQYEHFQQGEMVEIIIQAEDMDGTIAEVSFYINDVLIGSSKIYPFNFKWNTLEVESGLYTIKIVVSDNGGLTNSAQVEIYISSITSPGETGNVTDIDGNIYTTVKIGEQWWMSENLKTSHYADGKEIPFVQDNELWDELDLTDKAYCTYFDGNGYTGVNSVLYNWSAAMNGEPFIENDPKGVQGVCPDGWHLPNDAEWKEMEMTLGMTQSEVDQSDFRGINEGSKLAGNFDLWYNGDLRNDMAFGNSGFNALPSGYRKNNGRFYGVYAYSTYWTSSQQNELYSWYRHLNNQNFKIGRNYSDKNLGCSVRCVKDND